MVPTDHPKETKAVFSGRAESAVLLEDEKHPFCMEASLPLAEDIQTLRSTVIMLETSDVV